jgi:hypothetical protein
MKNNDVLILEELYETVQATQFLIYQGYSKEEIEQLIAEGKFLDTVKNVSKKAARYVAPMAVAASSLMGGQAHGNDGIDGINKSLDEFKSAMTRYTHQSKDNARAEVNKLSEFLSNSIEKTFGKGVLSSDIKAEMQMNLMDVYKKDKGKIQDFLDNIKKNMEGKKLNDNFEVYKATQKALNALKS